MCVHFRPMLSYTASVNGFMCNSPSMIFPRFSSVYLKLVFCCRSFGSRTPLRSLKFNVSIVNSLSASPAVLKRRALVSFVLIKASRSPNGSVNQPHASYGIVLEQFKVTFSNPTYLPNLIRASTTVPHHLLLSTTTRLFRCPLPLSFFL